MKSKSQRTEVKLIAVDDVASVATIQRRLARRKLKIGVVTRESVHRQCVGIERVAIIGRKKSGEPVGYIFSWGRLWEREPSFSPLPVIVAIETQKGSTLPRGVWEVPPYPSFGFPGSGPAPIRMPLLTR